MCFAVNINSQNLNYFLKRGTSLEYSYTGELRNDAENIIENKLSSLNIKYNLIENEDIENYEYYDGDEVKVKNSLIISIPIKITEKNKELFNDISSFIFENFENAKLIDLRRLNEDYHTPYTTLKFYLIVMLISFVIWLLPYFLLKKTGIIKPKDDNENKEGGFREFIKKVKENGFGYFLKRVFFDEETAEGRNNLTWEIVSTIIFVLVRIFISWKNSNKFSNFIFPLNSPVI